MRVWSAFLLGGLLAGCLGGPGGDEGDAATVRGLVCPDPCAAVHPIEGLWEPHGAGAPNDPDHMVLAFRSNRADGIETMVTRDGGLSWQDGLVALGPSSPSPVLRKYTHSGDAVVAITHDGTVLVAGLGANVTDVPDDAEGALDGVGAGAGSYAGRAIYVARSTDGGLTFPDAFEVQPGAGHNAWVQLPVEGEQDATVAFDSTDKQWLAVAPDGTVLLAWTAIRAPQPYRIGGAVQSGGSYSYDLMAAVSRDAGATFAAPMMLEEDTVWKATHPAITADGSMAIAYGNLFGGDLVLYASPDGASWTQHEVGTTGGQPILLPGDAPGELHLLYPFLADGASYPVLRTSQDGGATFDDGLQLDGAIGDWFVNVCLDTAPDGTMVASWYDELPDGTLSYKARGIRADGERTPMVVLASGLTGPSGTNGDYVCAVSAVTGGAIVAWVEVRDGERAMATARLAWDDLPEPASSSSSPSAPAA